ncbi:MAG: gamma-glutamyl-gamma-aminobutyrate hydrolase family protein [Schlesneria sp.]
MKTKPVIGINGDYRPARKDALALSWFNTGYYDSINTSGGLPMLIPPHASDDDLRQTLEMCDGVVLAGCSMDLDPMRLGMEPHPHTRPMPVRREDFDRRMAKLAVEMRLPILAIGSGMQTLNVICGGTLIQHIPEAVPRALHHRDPVERHNRHIIEIVEGTRCWDIYGPGEIRVNSEHHMAVNRLASCFKASAHAPDGVIECYESTDPEWFCLGVQWHPEDDTASALDMQVFQEFMSAAHGSEPTILKMPQRVAA